VGIEGELTITLERGEVLIDSSRPVHASRVFRKKPLDEVLQSVPMLFSVCGTAQVCAAVRAAEQALEHPASPLLEGVRESLVRMETLREHLWRVLLDWPNLLGEPPIKQGMAEMLVLQRDFRQLLTAAGEPFRITAAALGEVEPVALTTLVQRVAAFTAARAFQRHPAEWLELESLEALQRWIATTDTPAAALLQRVVRQRWEALGRCEIEPLPLLEPEWLQQMLEADSFIERPQWQGDSCETSSATRVDSPLLQQSRSHYGNGLMTRLLARLTEMAQLTQQLAPQPLEIDGGHGLGIGQVAAARGQLVHSVVLEGERVSRYRILAPTEWNFHPQGVVARALSGLAGEQVEQQARLLISAIDPCVGYQLEICDA
jgi:hypothetical protein